MWESGLPRASPCPAWQNTCSWGTPGGLPWLCSYPWAQVSWLGHLWSETHPWPWPWKIHVVTLLSQWLLCCWPRCWSCGGQNSKVFPQMQLLQENGAGHLSWLDYPVSSCYLGRAIITMFLGPPVVIPPSGGVGEGGEDRCSKGSTFSKSTEFHFG